MLNTLMKENQDIKLYWKYEDSTNWKLDTLFSSYANVQDDSGYVIDQDNSLQIKLYLYKSTLKDVSILTQFENDEVTILCNQPIDIQYGVNHPLHTRIINFTEESKDELVEIIFTFISSCDNFISKFEIANKESILNLIQIPKVD